MLRIYDYDRRSAVDYAAKWAYSRNPEYLAFDNLGGDCTNFISQCVYAGSGIMNYTPTFGWYYINGSDKSPSWTGVSYFYDFLTANKGQGPFAEVTNIYGIELGDVIQLGDANGRFYHSLLVTRITGRRRRTYNNIFISAHDNNAYMRRLSTYRFANIRFLHIVGVRKP